MYRKILVPLDGSGLAEGVLPHVIDLAQEHVARPRIVLVRAVPAFEGALTGSGYVDVRLAEDLLDLAQAEARQYLEAKAGELRAQGLAVDVHVVRGVPAQVILDLAVSERVELLAMTTHGRSGVSRLLHGSVAEEVLHAAPCPVLLISARGLPAARPAARAVHALV